MRYSIKQRANPLDRTEAKFYAAPDYGEEIDISMLADEISKSCTLTPTDIVAVIESFLDKMPRYLKNSNRVRLNKFGIFKLSFSSAGRERREDVSAADIKNVRILFMPSAKLKHELSDICFSRK